MSQNSEQRDPRAGELEPTGVVRSWVRIASVLLILICVGSIALILKNRYEPEASSRLKTELVPAVGENTVQPQPAELVSEPASIGTGIVSANLPAVAQPVPAALSTPQVTVPEPSPESRQLVNRLSRPGQVGQPLTAEQAAEWKQSLQQLIQQGASGVPAILEFLKQNKDLDFGSGTSQALGYASARQAMFDVLGQIGGPEAISGLLQILQTSGAPREIALVAQYLERLEPGQHRQDQIEAAQQVLATASARKFEAPDVVPLFEVMREYGGPAVATELEQAARQWSYYGTIALAQLPDGAGIPALINIVQDLKTVNVTREAAFQMLAQVSAQFPEARAVLLQQAQSGTISDYGWRLMTSVLAGAQVGLLNPAFENRQGLAEAPGLRTISTSDNQTYFVLATDLTAGQLTERTALIDELLSATSDPSAKQVLRESKDLLVKRQPAMAVVPLPP